MITLATLKDATAQQVFDQVATHLLTQNARSIKKLPNRLEEGCSYRSDTGLKCAAGCLIADDEYDPRFDKEDMAWRHLVHAEIVPNTHKEMICRLQNLHDSWLPEEWPDELRKLARKHALSDAVLH